jgi:alginate O-acetyltransferase complex protein AlgI
MVFSSIVFLCFFLPIFMAAYFLAPTIKAKNIVTVLLSFVFYGWGGPYFTLVLLGSIAINMAAALYIDRQDGARRKAAVAVTIAFNLLVLAVFKYCGFVVSTLDAVLAPLGMGLRAPRISLPFGISFFTFHCLSYVIDVYRRRFPANRNALEIALYISLFPQLLAGPIVRYKTIAQQLAFRRHTLGRASVGARMFIIGLAQKVLIADQVAPLAVSLFDHTPHPTMTEAWLGLLAYTLQIYFDFAGYSNIAIGIGLVLGFGLPRNFLLPYTSRSITEFWRRWHMSLSAWLRDYLYIPLGGNRRGTARTYQNLATVFVLCGLWHGANWTFVLWGAWHGGFLVLERAALGRWLLRLPSVARWVYTLLAVMGGWVLFRAPDFTDAWQFYGGLVGGNGIVGIDFQVHFALQPTVILALVTGCLLAVLPRWVHVPANSRAVVGILDNVWVLGLLLLALIWVAAGTYSPFLYYRF